MGGENRTLLSSRQSWLCLPQARSLIQIKPAAAPAMVLLFVMAMKRSTDMFSNPSLITRIAVGKAVGFAIGLIGFVALPYVWPEAGWLLRWGILLWYTTVGAIIGMFGVFTEHPVLKLPLPWWLRASIIGGWMNFVLVFFAFETMQAILVSVMGPQSVFTSPFWFVLEGVLVGLIIGFLATRIGGEGPQTVQGDIGSRPKPPGS
ncbi:MAG: hypothetical protein ACTSUD_03405 [Alphaproteobacteria bacterium]